MKTYEEMIQELEAEGLSTSDAQAVLDANTRKGKEEMKKQLKTKTILFKLTKDQHKAIMELAAKHSEGNVSAFIRKAVMSYDK